MARGVKPPLNRGWLALGLPPGADVPDGLLAFPPQAVRSVMAKPPAKHLVRSATLDFNLARSPGSNWMTKYAGLQLPRASVPGRYPFGADRRRVLPQEFLVEEVG